MGTKRKRKEKYMQTKYELIIIPIEEEKKI